MPIADLDGVSLRHIVPPIGRSILLAAVHLRRKQFASDADQTQLAVGIAADIARAESALGHSRTVVFGNLNMTHLRTGWLEALRFMRRTRAWSQNERSELSEAEARRFFYNPMWSMLGERDGRAPGTYYCDRGRPITYYWNTFDEVLVRPAF